MRCCPQSRPGFGIRRVNLGRLKSLLSALFEKLARRSDRPSVHRKQHLGTCDLNNVNEYHSSAKVDPYSFIDKQVAARLA